MSALFFSKAAYKIYYYQVRWDKGNEQGFFWTREESSIRLL